MNLLHDWLKTVLPHTDFTLSPLKGDASFRQYYRLTSHDKTYIAVNAPPATENNPGFIEISKAYLKLDLRVPEVLSFNLDQGFLLLTDLGDDVLFQQLNTENSDELYTKSLIELGKLQHCPLDLPHFNTDFIKLELENFEHWMLKKHLKLNLSPVSRHLIQQAFSVLLQSAAEQPQCSIHRDYHSRNLMILDNNQIGILDFQDAMRGPITYDLISLIRDCYIDWPREKVIEWALLFHGEFLAKTIPSQEQFLRYMDLMGIQRHLKASFIFARKFHRDSVDHYLKDIPRTLNYIIQVSENYPELRDFKTFIEDL